MKIDFIGFAEPAEATSETSSRCVESVQNRRRGDATSFETGLNGLVMGPLQGTVRDEPQEVQDGQPEPEGVTLETGTVSQMACDIANVLLALDEASFPTNAALKTEPSAADPFPTEAASGKESFTPESLRFENIIPLDSLDGPVAEAPASNPLPAGGAVDEPITGQNGAFPGSLNPPKAGQSSAAVSGSFPMALTDEPPAASSRPVPDQGAALVAAGEATDGAENTAPNTPARSQSMPAQSTEAATSGDARKGIGNASVKMPGPEDPEPAKGLTIPPNEPSEARAEPDARGTPAKIETYEPSGRSRTAAGTEAEGRPDGLAARPPGDAFAQTRQAAVVDSPGTTGADPLERMEHLREVVRQMAVDTTRFGHGQNRSVTVTLSPESLGKVVFSCHEAGGRLSVVITTETEVARDALHGLRNEVVRLVQQEGFRSVELNIRTDADRERRERSPTEREPRAELPRAAAIEGGAAGGEAVRVVPAWDRESRICFVA